MAAVVQPKRRQAGRHVLAEGKSYPVDAYERAIREVLGRVSLGADVVAQVVEDTRAPEPDRLALARIERERDAVLARYRRDRDPELLETAMVRLDAEESRAREANSGAPLEAAEVVAFLRDLPALWDAAPSSRRALAESLFESVDVLGLRSVAITPSPAAIARGLAEAFRSGGAGYGRGERI